MAINVRRNSPRADLASTYSFLQGLIVLGFALIVLSVYLVDVTTRRDVRASVFDRLPEYPSAVLVQEYDSGLNGVFTAVREYAVEGDPEQVATHVTSFYREWLLPRGWLEEETRASFSTFTKGDAELVLGRVGSLRMVAPPEAVVRQQGSVPAISSFFFAIRSTGQLVEP